MNAETMMKEYKQMKLELQVTEMQLQRFMGISDDDVIRTLNFNHSDDERVQTSGTSDKTCKVAFNYKKIMARQNEDWYNFLLKRYVKLKEDIDFFENCINSLPENISEIMFELLDEDTTWDSIVEKYHISRSTISKYRKRALKEINVMYECRESCVEEYILS